MWSPVTKDHMQHGPRLHRPNEGTYEHALGPTSSTALPSLLPPPALHFVGTIYLRAVACQAALSRFQMWEYLFTKRWLLHFIFRVLSHLTCASEFLHHLLLAFK